jgi:hypothetical protein
MGQPGKEKKKTRLIRVLLFHIIHFVGDRLANGVIADHLFRFIALDQPMGQQKAVDQ